MLRGRLLVGRLLVGRLLVGRLLVGRLLGGRLLGGRLLGGRSPALDNFGRREMAIPVPESTLLSASLTSAHSHKRRTKALTEVPSVVRSRGFCCTLRIVLDEHVDGELAAGASTLLGRLRFVVPSSKRLPAISF
jgi:hypothetical protein